MYKSKSYYINLTRGGSRNNDRAGVRHFLGTSLIDEEEYKYGRKFGKDIVDG